MESLIIVILLIILLTICVVSIRRKLLVLDENVDNAMSQIGVQISSRFDAMTALLNQAKAYASCESLIQMDAIKARRNVITANSLPNEVLGQEGVIAEGLDCIGIVAEQHPELKLEEWYTKYMDAVECYEKMVRTSLLIYNDSVAKLNRMIRIIPIKLVAGMLGFRQRDYLDISENDKYTKLILQTEE